MITNNNWLKNIVKSKLPLISIMRAKAGGKAIQPITSHYALRTMQTLLMCITLQFPVIGHCDTGSGWLKNLFESKGKTMQDVATKVAELPEDAVIGGLDFSPDGKYLAATSPNSLTIHIWDWQAGKIIHSVDKADGGNDGLSTEPIRYSPDGSLLVTCHDRAANNIVVRIWNTDTWKIVHDIEDPVGGTGCNAVVFSPDGKSLFRVLSRLYFPGDNLIVYDTSTWQPVWGLRTVPFNPDSLAISPDGKFVALGGMTFNSNNAEQPLIQIVNMEQRGIVREIQAFPAQQTIQMVGTIARLAWSPDGMHIAAGVSGSNSNGFDAIRIFDTPSGKQIANEPAPMGTHIRGLRYTPDGKYLIEAGIGKSVEIWDGQHRELLQNISRDEEAESLAVSPDGHYFAVGGYKNIQIWQLK